MPGDLVELSDAFKRGVTVWRDTTSGATEGVMGPRNFALILALQPLALQDDQMGGGIFVVTSSGLLGWVYIHVTDLVKANLKRW